LLSFFLFRATSFKVSTSFLDRDKIRVDRQNANKNDVIPLIELGPVNFLGQTTKIFVSTVRRKDNKDKATKDKRVSKLARKNTVPRGNGSSGRYRVGNHKLGPLNR